MSPLIFSALISAHFHNADAEDWAYYGQDPGGARFSALDQINRANVAQLERAWTYRTGDIAEGTAHYTECTPLMVDGVLYLITPFSRLIALDATTGEEQFRFSPDPPVAAFLSAQGIHRSLYHGARYPESN